MVLYEPVEAKRSTRLKWWAGRGTFAEIMERVEGGGEESDDEDWLSGPGLSSLI